jgi:AcrR family transcriptional regulator
MAHEKDTGMRSDAKANRDRILDIAHDMFAANPDASLNSIAKAAGIGPGTLYRHFPSREALILALYRKEIDALVALAPALTARHLPLKAFRMWCARLAEYGRVKHGLTDVLHAIVTDEDFRATYHPMINAIAHLLSAGEKSGDFRRGVKAEDLLLLLGFLWRIKPGPGSKAQADRLINLVMEGLKRHR